MAFACNWCTFSCYVLFASIGKCLIFWIDCDALIHYSFLHTGSASQFLRGRFKYDNDDWQLQDRRYRCVLEWWTRGRNILHGERKFFLSLTPVIRSALNDEKARHSSQHISLMRPETREMNLICFSNEMTKNSHRRVISFRSSLLCMYFITHSTSV